MDILCDLCNGLLSNNDIAQGNKEDCFYCCEKCRNTDNFKLQERRAKRSLIKKTFQDTIDKIIISVLILFIITLYLIISTYGETIQEKKTYIKSTQEKNKPFDKYKSPPKKFK